MACSPCGRAHTDHTMGGKTARPRPPLLCCVTTSGPKNHNMHHPHTSPLLSLSSLSISPHIHARSPQTQTRFLAPPTKRHYNTIKLKANGTFLVSSSLTTSTYLELLNLSQLRALFPRVHAKHPAACQRGSHPSLGQGRGRDKGQSARRHKRNRREQRHGYVGGRGPRPPHVLLPVCRVGERRSGILEMKEQA